MNKLKTLLASLHHLTSPWRQEYAKADVNTIVARRANDLEARVKELEGQVTHLTALFRTEVTRAQNKRKS